MHVGPAPSGVGPTRVRSLGAGLLAGCSAVAAGDAADALGLYAEVRRHGGVADVVAFVECLDDVLAALAEGALKVRECSEALAE